MKNKLHLGCCLEFIKAQPTNTYDSIVTDPPYGLKFMGKGWDSPDNIVFTEDYWKEVLRVLKPGAHVIAFSGSRTYHWLAVAMEKAGFEIRDQILWVYGSGFPKGRNIGKATNDKKWEGWNTALKPAHEPMVLAMKPIKGTITQNVLEHGTGAINIDGCRNGERFPTNLILDDSKEVKDLFPHTKKGGAIRKDYKINNNIYGDMSMLTSNHTEGYGDSGSAARFFYSAKTSKKDRDEGLENRNIHPTVKPTDLMRYLVRLVTPKGGLVLDPFMGSGSTGKAIAVENELNNTNWTFHGCEILEEYFDMSKARIEKGSKEFIKRSK